MDAVEQDACALMYMHNLVAQIHNDCILIQTVVCLPASSMACCILILIRQWQADPFLFIVTCFHRLLPDDILLTDIQALHPTHCV